MSKTITSPVERWAGTITLYDPLTLQQVSMFHKAVWAAVDLGKQYPDPSSEMYFSAVMPGLYACIEKIDLQNFPGVNWESFPAKPRKDSLRLAKWLHDEILKLVNEEDKPVPKESTETLTPKPTDGSTQADSPSEAKS